MNLSLSLYLSIYLSLSLYIYIYIYIYIIHTVSFVGSTSIIMAVITHSVSPPLALPASLSPLERPLRKSSPDD